MKKILKFENDEYIATIEATLENGNFSCCGKIKEKEYSSLCCGQCIDEIKEAFPKNKKIAKICKLWKLYHLNDMHAGTPEQEKELDRVGLSEYANKYTECCEYLKKVGLYEVNGYKFGTGWLKWEIPAKDLKEIEGLLK